MKLIWSIILAWVPSSLAFANCLEPEVWPKLTAWVCAVGDEMTHRDRTKNYQRTIKMITDHDDIERMRAEMNTDDNQVCRIFRSQDYYRALGRITTQQGFKEDFATAARDESARELQLLSSRGRLTSCEGELLIEGAPGEAHEYHQYHYLKLGPQREYKNILIHVMTLWPAGS